MTQLFDPQTGEFNMEAWIQSSEETDRDHKFADDHEDEWMRLYPDEFVVVYQQKLVAHGPVVPQTLQAAVDAGVPIGQTVRRFMATKPLDVIL